MAAIATITRFAFGGASTFPGDARQIIVSATQPPIVIAPGYPVPDSTAGYAYVSASALTGGRIRYREPQAAPLPDSRREARWPAASTSSAM